MSFFKKIIILLFLSIIWYYTSINAGTVPIIYNASWLPSNTWGVTVVPNMTLSGIIWAQTGQIWGGRISGGWVLVNATPFYFRQDGSGKEFQLQYRDGWLTKMVQVKLVQSGVNISSYVLYARYWFNFSSFWADYDIIASNAAPIATWPFGAWYWSPFIVLLVDDGTVPILTLSGSSSITIAQGSSYTDSGARWTDNLDGSWTLYTWTWWATGSFQISGTVNTAIVGTYILQYQKVDRWGNKSTIITRTVQVTDQTPPDTTITSWIFSWALTNISSQGFTFTSNEIWSTFQCKIDSNAWQTCWSPFTTWYSDWTHTIFVRAIDSVNNIDSTPASRTFTIDTTPPTSATVTVNIDSPYSIDNPQISFTGSYDIHFSHYEISVDWWSFSTQNSPYIPWSLVSWSHIVIVRSYDSVWNYSEAEVKFPPVAQIIAPTTLSSGTITDTTIIINGISWDLVQAITFSGVWLWFNCGSLPQSVPITCTGGIISTSWIFEVSASNGVVTWKNSQIYIIDTVSPTVILNWGSNITVAHGSIYTDSWASWTDNVDGWDSVLTGIWWGLWSFALSWTVNTNILGTYTLAYQKVDRVGNKTTVTRIVNVIDQTPPVVTINGSSTVDVLKNTLYIESGATWTDNVDGTWTNVIMSWSVNTWVVGSYSVEYTKIDAAGNTGNTVIRTVNVILWDTPIMTLNGSGLVTIEVHNTYTDLGVTATDTEQWNMTASVVMSWVIDIHTLWTYTIEYLLTDAQWNTAIPVTRTIQVADTTPPLINLLWGASASVVKWYAYVDSGATCTDNYDTTCVVNTSGTVNTWVIDNYVIAYNAVDINGNNATWVIRTIQVITGSMPVITLNGSWVMTVAQGSTYIDLGATAMDNEDGNITINMTTSWSVNTNVLWIYTITYDITDKSWNRASTITRIVQVVESQWTSGWWGWNSIRKDNCPHGDYTNSYYDNECGEKPIEETLCNSKDEFKKAYCFARENDITTINNFIESNATWSLIRKDLAKMMVNFSRNVLWTLQNTTTSQCKNNYNDVSGVSKELRTYIELACSMNIMWLEADWRTPLSSFRPSDYVTRAEFATVLSRVLYGNTYDVWLWSDYIWYEKHLSKLNTEWFINNITEGRPLYIEKRWYTWIILERVSQKKQ